MNKNIYRFVLFAMPIENLKSIFQNIEKFVKLLKDRGITILDEITEYEGLGKFVHILDIEGNKIELWEPQKITVVE